MTQLFITNSHRNILDFEKHGFFMQKIDSITLVMQKDVVIVRGSNVLELKKQRHLVVHFSTLQKAVRNPLIYPIQHENITDMNLFRNSTPFLKYK